MFSPRSMFGYSDKARLIFVDWVAFLLLITMANKWWGWTWYWGLVFTVAVLSLSIITAARES